MTDKRYYAKDLKNIADKVVAEIKIEKQKQLEIFVEDNILAICLRVANNGEYERRFEKHIVEESGFTLDEVKSELISCGLTVIANDKHFPNHFKVMWDSIED